MSRPDIEAIRARAEKASRGPWAAYNAMCCPDMGGVSGPDRRVCQAEIGARGHPMDLEDAEFCAAARQDIPDLLAYVDELEKALQTAKAMLGDFNDTTCSLAENVEWLRECYEAARRDALEEAARYFEEDFDCGGHSPEEALGRDLICAAPLKLAARIRALATPQKEGDK